MVFASCEKVPNDNNGKEDEEIIDENLPTSLKGKAYIPIYLDSEAAKAIEKRMVGDMRLDGKNQLYLWENTYEGNTASGMNFYGNLAGFLSLSTTGMGGWSGGGFCRPVEQGFFSYSIDMNEIEDWYLHLAYRPDSEDESHEISIYWGPNASQVYKFSIGFKQHDASTLMKPINNGGVCTVGEWNEYEIKLDRTGMDYSMRCNGNYFCFASGGVRGTTLNLDAVFYYKK